MQASIAGLIVCLAVLATGFVWRAPLLLGLFLSLAFGSTALVTLSSLGGSSPLIYTIFAALLVAATTLRRRFLQEFGTVFGSVRTMWLLVALMLYAAVSAFLFPRLFAGQTTSFVQSPQRFGVIEVPLSPVSGNISQTGYFLLGGFTAIALTLILFHRDRFDLVRKGVLLFVIAHTAMGLIDLAGKLGGVGDLLEPIRTASYVMLTETSEAGFARITGAYSEASGFGGMSLACIAFVYVDWRRTGSRLSAALTVILLLLLLLSTSSTAYVGMAVLALPLAASLGTRIGRGRLDRPDLAVLIVGFAGLIAFLAVLIYNERAFDAFGQLIDTMVINKHSSSSGQERAYWNSKSLEALVDTSGFGLGFGSSRASSWPIAVLSQLGVIGALMMAGFSSSSFAAWDRWSPGSTPAPPIRWPGSAPSRSAGSSAPPSTAAVPIPASSSSSLSPQSLPHAPRRGLPRRRRAPPRRAACFRAFPACQDVRSCRQVPELPTIRRPPPISRSACRS